MFPNDDSPPARGARLRQLRQMAGLATIELAQLAGFSRASISYWENAAHSGLSHKGAEKIIKVLSEKYNIKCDVGWLLLGIGEMPMWYTTNAPQKPVAKKENGFQTNISNHDKRHHEIEQFTKTYEQSVVIQIKHDFMQPLCEQGDWVGGCWLPINTSLIGKSCIVKIKDKLEVRILKESIQYGKYNLCFMTYSENAAEPFELRDLSLMEVAPIIRIWK